MDSAPMRGGDTPQPERPFFRVRPLAITVVLCLSTFQLAKIFHAQYPIQHWLFWRYALSWVLSLTFAVSCLSAGYRVVRALTAEGYEADGFWVFCFSTGVFAFFLAMFVMGVLGLYGPFAFFFVPI